MVGAVLAFLFWPAHVERYGIPAEQAVLAGRCWPGEPPRLLEYSWDADLLRFELTLDGDGGTWFVTIELRGTSSTAPRPDTTPASTSSPNCWTPARRVKPVIDPLGDLEERYAALLADDGTEHGPDAAVSSAAQSSALRRDRRVRRPRSSMTDTTTERLRLDHLLHDRLFEQRTIVLSGPLVDENIVAAVQCPAGAGCR